MPETGGWKGKPYIRTRDKSTEIVSIWSDRGPESGEAVITLEPDSPSAMKVGERVSETQYVTTKNGRKIVNGLPHGKEAGETDFFPVGSVKFLNEWKPGNEQPTSTGPLGPLAFFREIQNSEIPVLKTRTGRAVKAA